VEPQYPYPYYPGYQPPAPQRRHSGVDIALTVILSGLTGVFAAGAVSFSFFFVMATDSCGPQHCDYDALGAAYLVTWGGIGVAILVGAVGIIVAAIRKLTMWYWPAGSLLIVIASAGAGLSLANSVMHHNGGGGGI
jgi:hypothetical protein